MTHTTTPTKIAIIGAGGRMGRMLIETTLTHPNATLHAAIDAAGSDVLGLDAGTLVGQKPAGCPITDQMTAVKGADAIIDFTVPKATANLAPVAAEYGVAHIIGTTGLDDEQEAILAVAAEQNTLVWAPNFSAGVTLMLHVTEQVARSLDDSYDIEVVEMHHKHKVDAPSGTALGLGKAAAAGRGVELEEKGVFSRHGITGAREQGSIGFATLRGGEVIGDHTIMFADGNERIELTHKAQTRGVFAAGAVRAAIWAAQKGSVGLYDMKDVLGLTNS